VLLHRLGTKSSKSLYKLTFCIWHLTENASLSAVRSNCFNAVFSLFTCTFCILRTILLRNKIVRRRVEFKIATLVFKALNGLAPPYLVDDCNLVSDDIRRLRSAVSFTCALPRTRTRLGDRSFAVAVPRVWNCLPAALRTVEDYEQFRELIKHICSIRLRGLVTFAFRRRV